MKALRWYGTKDVRVERVDDPVIREDRDVILEVTSTAICGSDLHLYHGYMPTMEKGDILGHEFMGRVIEKGPGVTNLAIGDRVVVPFTISCGRCPFCARQLWSLCDTTNPNGEKQKELYGASTAGLFGYSHLYGGYAGGQAEYVRVPCADVGPIRIPDELSDDAVLFMSDILPTAWMAVENAAIRPGDTVAVWGCGPVGLLAIRCAWLQGAGRVIAIDRVPERLALAREKGLAEVIDYSTVDVVQMLNEICDGQGPHACIDAVGMEAHGTSLGEIYDYVKQAVKLETDRPNVLRQAIQACRKGGTVSIPGVYGGFIDKVPFGTAFAKGLTFRMGQTHVQKYLPMLLQRIRAGEIDPGFIISHRLPLDSATAAYEIFSKHEDRCTKVVLKPGMKRSPDDEGLAVGAVPATAARPTLSIGRGFAGVLDRLCKQGLLPAPC
jgi:threonine dehydrogenase-like Zn-dependent dehydrogenase